MLAVFRAADLSDEEASASLVLAEGVVRVLDDVSVQLQRTYGIEIEPLPHVARYEAHFGGSSCPEVGVVDRHSRVERTQGEVE